VSLKAIALISGGLDSALAAEVIKLGGIDVKGIAFITPFMHPQVEELAKNIDIQIKVIDISAEYLDLIKNPCFGFGKNLNPCIDCHIFMLKKAKGFMLEYKADFVITGEVLGQRPMSQNRSALRRIEKESGLEGLLLRPLSAQLLPPTIPEQEGWVERSSLFDFSGRSRKPQIELARQLGLEGFSQPAGGCLLTDPGFSQRLKDLLTYQREFNLDDIQLLKLGRHFRVSSQAKLVLGRNHQENQRLMTFACTDNLVLRPRDIPGPIGILNIRTVSEELLELSAGILARYCDRNNGRVWISIEGNNGSRLIGCFAAKPEDSDSLRI
jgi:tRNA-specific 2-thiouridylase